MIKKRYEGGKEGRVGRCCSDEDRTPLNALAKAEQERIKGAKNTEQQAQAEMKVIHKERRTGKTAELIELASREGGYIVCHSQDEAYRISKVAEENGKQILFPLVYEEFLSGSFCGKNIKAFYIDNVDFLLARIARGVPVKAISINKEKA